MTDDGFIRLTPDDLAGSSLSEAIAGFESPIYVAPAIGINFVEAWEIA